MGKISDNYFFIKENIKNILKKLNKKEKEVTLVAVTKYRKLDDINELVNLGIENIGENKTIEFLEKYDNLPKSLKKHFIGNLQSKKFKDIVGKTDLIHSLDRISLLNKIEIESKKNDLITNVLIELNISGEETKHGLALEELDDFIIEVQKCENVRVLGFMTMAPYDENPENIRWVFRKAKSIFDDYKNKNLSNIEMKFLSMGMSNDYEIALEEGSNMIRIGTLFFK